MEEGRSLWEQTRCSFISFKSLFYIFYLLYCEFEDVYFVVLSRTKEFDLDVFFLSKSGDTGCQTISHFSDYLLWSSPAVWFGKRPTPPNETHVKPRRKYRLQNVFSGDSQGNMPGEVNKHKHSVNQVLLGLLLLFLLGKEQKNEREVSHRHQLLLISEE